VPRRILPKTLKISVGVAALAAVLWAGAATWAATGANPPPPRPGREPSAAATPAHTLAPAQGPSASGAPAHAPEPVQPQAPASAAGQTPAPPSFASPMSGAEIIKLLDETIDWYRTLGDQQKIADEPSDQLILTENRQIAGEVTSRAFDFARACAALVAKTAPTEAPSGEADTPSRSLAERQRKLDAQLASIQSEMDADRAKLASTQAKGRAALQAKLTELQGELDLLNAKKGILASVMGALSGSDPGDAGALRSQIEAMAVALPASASGNPVAGNATPGAAVAAAAHSASPAPLPSGVATAEGSRFGLLDQAEAVYKLYQKDGSIVSIDRRSERLQSSLSDVRKRLVDEMRALSARGDALMAQADSADSAALADVRGELDAIAGEFKQSSGIVVPLSKEVALLDQYRRNLANWRAAVDAEIRGALESLGIRLGVLLVVLGAVFALAEVWHRAVLKYVQDSRRRYQLLLLRRIALWSLVVIIVGIAFANELGSVVTFAGLITAGLAVAMQSVLVSIVGYFFLIGKYGIRVGDRVQIGDVNGEIIEIGLVRMYLMELAGHGSAGPTGRVAAFPNSVVFQVSSGLFKQIPGVNFAWHDITLSVPAGVDYASTKERLFAAATEALADYREEIERQSRELKRTTLSSSAAGEALPTVQLAYSVKGVDAHVRYPVHLPHAAEIDERMSRALLQVISSLAPEGPGR
jgi:small-conductance mechanosensitive channel